MPILSKKSDQPLELPKNEYVKLAHVLGRTGFWLFSSTLLVWMVVGIGIPFLAGAMKKGPEYLTYLQRISAYEERLAVSNIEVYHPTQARLDAATAKLPPRRLGDGVVLPTDDEPIPLAAASHVSAARALIEHVIDDGVLARGGVFLQHGVDQEAAEVAQHSATPDGLVAKTHVWLLEHIHDDTWAVIRELGVIWLSRLSAVLASFAVFIPIIIAAFFLGEAKARMLEEDGNMLMSERSKMFSGLLLFLPPLVTTMPAIPIPMNTLVVIPFLLALVVVTVYFFRANFIEV